MTLSREFFIPKGATKVCDKKSDAVAYLYNTPKGSPAALVFFGKQSKPITRYSYRSEAEREACITRTFLANQERAARKGGNKAERKAKAIEFAAAVEVGDIFHYSFGYDETHHVFYEVTEIMGRHAMVRRIAQAQRDLGYDNRHQCAPQSGDFIGEPVRVLLQDGLIKVDRHYHASKWNTARVAGVPIGPSYSGGGMH